MSDSTSNLEKLRQRKKVSIRKLAEIVGAGYSTIYNYEKGITSSISDDLLKRLAEALEVEPGEIRSEAGSGKGIILTDEGAQYHAAPLKKTRSVPVVSWAGCAAIGDRGLDFTDSATQIAEHVETETWDPNAFGLIAEGDSMTPEIMPGDRLVFAPNEEPRNGDVVVARLKTGAVLVKRFRRVGPEGKKVRLESTHPEYPAKEYGMDEFRFIYPAVDLKRKMRR